MILGPTSGLLVHSPYITTRADDAASQNFFSRTGALAVGGAYSEAVARDAINDLVVKLRKASLWSKFLALYPFIGPSAATQAENLVSSSYKITWVSSPTFNANGVTGNGTSSYGQCVGLTQQVHGHLVGMSVYIRVGDAVGDFKRLIGSFDAGASDLYFIDRCNAVGFESERAFAGGGGTGVNNNKGVVPSVGLFQSERTSTTAFSCYTNGVLLGASASNAGLDNGLLTTREVYILAVNATGVAGNFTTSNLALASVHQGLTAGEALTFYNLVQAYQTALGRQV